MNWNCLRSISVDQVVAVLKWAAALVLQAGLGSSVWVWRAQDQIEREAEAVQAANSAAPFAPLDSRKHVRDVEINYGPMGVLVEKAAELFHGKTLAKTIAVLSILIATGLFLVAARLSDDPPAPL